MTGFESGPRTVRVKLPSLIDFLIQKSVFDGARSKSERLHSASKRLPVAVKQAAVAVPAERSIAPAGPVPATSCKPEPKAVLLKPINPRDPTKRWKMKLQLQQNYSKPSQFPSLKLRTPPSGELAAEKTQAFENLRVCFLKFKRESLPRFEFESRKEPLSSSMTLAKHRMMQKHAKQVKKLEIKLKRGNVSMFSDSQSDDASKVVVKSAYASSANSTSLYAALQQDRCNYLEESHNELLREFDESNADQDREVIRERIIEEDL